MRGPPGTELGRAGSAGSGAHRSDACSLLPQAGRGAFSGFPRAVQSSSCPSRRQAGPCGDLEGLRLQAPWAAAAALQPGDSARSCHRSPLATPCPRPAQPSGRTRRPGLLEGHRALPVRAAYGPGASPKRLFSRHRVRPPAGALASSAIWRSGSLSRPGLSVLARKLGVSIPPVSNGTDVPNSAWHGVGLPESGLPLCAHSVPAPGCFPLGASVPVASLPGQKPSLWSPERTPDPFLRQSEVTDRSPPAGGGVDELPSAEDPDSGGDVRGLACSG